MVDRRLADEGGNGMDIDSFAGSKINPKNQGSPDPVSDRGEPNLFSTFLKGGRLNAFAGRPFP